MIIKTNPLLSKKVEGLIISVTPYQETSVICNVLTKDSLTGILIKGVRKSGSKTLKYANILTNVSYLVTNGSIGVFKEGIIVNNYLNIKQDVNTYNLVMVMIEKIKKLAISITDYETLYNFTLSILSMIESGLDPVKLVTIFELKLLYLLGVGLNFNLCQRCNNLTTKPTFVISLGGVVCEKCQSKQIVDLNYQDTLSLKQLYLVKYLTINQDVINQLNCNENILTFIDKYYSYHLEFTSKTKQILKKLGVKDGK